MVQPLAAFFIGRQKGPKRSMSKPVVIKIKVVDDKGRVRTITFAIAKPEEDKPCSK